MTDTQGLTAKTSPDTALGLVCFSRISATILCLQSNFTTGRKTDNTETSIIQKSIVKYLEDSLKRKLTDDEKIRLFRGEILIPIRKLPKGN